YFPYVLKDAELQPRTAGLPGDSTGFWTGLDWTDKGLELSMITDGTGLLAPRICGLRRRGVPKPWFGGWRKKITPERTAYEQVDRWVMNSIDRFRRMSIESGLTFVFIRPPSLF
ncbi:MAG: hypothetical protein M1820_005422, partial [Bogoriella megaspora]